MAFREGNRRTVYKHETLRNVYIVHETRTWIVGAGYIAYCAGKIGTFSSAIDAQVALADALNAARNEDRLTRHLVLKAKKVKP